MRFGLSVLMAVSLISLTGVPVASADDFAYYLSHNTTAVGGGTYGTIDLNTGVTSTIAPYAPPCCGGATSYNGLGVANGQLYTTSYYNPGATTDSALFHITPASTASASSFVSSDSGSNIGVFGSTTAGLYAVDDSGNLLSVNPTTGAATVIGATGLGNGGSGLSANGSTLYLTEQSTLYTVNTATGTATAVGNTGPYDFLSMVYEDGTLYGAAKDTANGLNYVAEINPTTGAVSDAVLVSGQFPATDRIWGLASVSAVSAPEIDPASATAGLTLLLGALLVLRGRRIVKLNSAST